MLPRQTIDVLKQQLAKLEERDAQNGSNSFTLGAATADKAIGGLSRGALHEVLPASLEDGAAATGFALALALRSGSMGGIVWIRDETVEQQAGRLYAPGIAEFGFDPTEVILVRTRGVADTLYAAEEAVRCSAIAAVLVETWGRPAALSLTATRRLHFAAEKSGVTALLIRRGADAEPSAAETRWLVRGFTSRPLEANAPGFPVFDLTLLRHRNGIIGRKWILEWVRDRQSFEERSALSRPVASVTANRPAATVVGFDKIRQAG